MGEDVGGSWQADEWVAQFIGQPQALEPLEFEYLPLPQVQLDADFTKAFAALDDQMERVRCLLEQAERGTMESDPSSDKS